MTALDLIDQAGGLLRSANDLIMVVSGTQKAAQGRPMVMRASVKNMKNPTAKQPVALLGPGDQVLVGGNYKSKLSQYRFTCPGRRTNRRINQLF
jgi:protein involved in polysaccharide export with SLBB domain